MKLMALVTLACIIPFLLAGMASCQTPGEHKETTGTDPAQPKAAPEPKPEVKPVAKADGNPMVVLETSQGNIKLELFRDKAPISVDNFLSYVGDGFYDGTIFHRVVKGFVIQAGGWDQDLKEKTPKAPIKNEATNGLSNLRGTLAVARTNEINSGTSHFFVNLKDNKFLDHQEGDPTKYGYAVFGKVIEGMDVVDKIAQVPVTAKGGARDVPASPVIITKARILGADKPKAEPAAEPKAEPKPQERKIEEKQIGEPETDTGSN
jgi:cyclophilin family peptidyl-prolyl cis-trans isomerase